jgi:hypothetical protein
MSKIVKISITLAVLVIIVCAVYYSEYKIKPVYVPLSPTGAANVAFCTAGNLTATVTFEPAAGNIYGTFTITNTSTQKCNVLANTFVKVEYAVAKNPNVNVVNLGQPSGQPFTLEPDQSIHAKSHYPNGPQCQSGVHPEAVTYTYKVSPDAAVTFTNPDVNRDFPLQVCSSNAEITEVDITNFGL